MKGTCGQEEFAKKDLEDSAKMSKGCGALRTQITVEVKLTLHL